MLKTEQMTTLEKKIEHFARILAARPGDELTILALAEASFRRGLKLEALTAYQDLVSGQPVPEAHLAVAEIYSAQGMSHEAYGELRRLFELDPDNVEARLLVNALQEDLLPPEDVGAIMNRPTSEAAFDEARLRLKIQRAIYNRELQERTRNVTLEPGTVIHEYHMEEAKKKLIRVDELLRELERLREFNHTLALEPPRAESISPQPQGASEIMAEVHGESLPTELSPPETYSPPLEVDTAVVGFHSDDSAPVMDELPSELVLEPTTTDGVDVFPLQQAEEPPIEFSPGDPEPVASSYGAPASSSDEFSFSGLGDDDGAALDIHPPSPAPELLSSPVPEASPEPFVSDIFEEQAPPLFAATAPEPAEFHSPSIPQPFEPEADLSLGSSPESFGGSIFAPEPYGEPLSPAHSSASVSLEESSPELLPFEGGHSPGAEQQSEPHFAFDSPSGFASDFDLSMDSPIAPDLPDARIDSLPPAADDVASMVELAPIDMDGSAHYSAEPSEPEALPETAAPQASQAVDVTPPMPPQPTFDDAPVRPETVAPVAVVTVMPPLVEDSTMILTAPEPEEPARAVPPSPVELAPAGAPESSSEVPAPQGLSAARQAFYQTHAEALSGLTTTLARTRGVTSIYLVAREGVTIDSVAKDEISEKRIGDLVKESFEFLEAFASDPAYWVLECQGGIFVMQKLDERHVLIAIGQAGANFGALRYTMDKTRTKFEQLLTQAPA